MKAMCVFSSKDATIENAEADIEAYLRRYGIVENDIREHKSYQSLASGWDLHPRTLQAQASMILENLATTIHAIKSRRRERMPFVRDAYHDLLNGFKAFLHIILLHECTEPPP